MSDPVRPRRRFVLPAAVAAVLAVLGIVLLVVALTGQQSPPRPSAGSAQQTSGSASAPSASAPSSSAQAAPPADPAPVQEDVPAPVALRIPTIDVDSDLVDLGLNDDGTVEVPPLSDVSQAGWYDGSPRPGATGPALLLGHVDSAEQGPGVFFDLGALSAGDEVDVTRADGTVAVFSVQRVASYPKAQFPTIDVYGNTPGPELRLITCGGAFDSSVRSYEDNIVVYATMSGTRDS